MDPDDMSIFPPLNRHNQPRSDKKKNVSARWKREEERARQKKKELDSMTAKEAEEKLKMEVQKDDRGENVARLLSRFGVSLDSRVVAPHLR
jgi:hypothetical protein